MSILACSRWTVGSGVVPVFLHSKRPLNGDAVLRHLRHFPSAIAFTAPSLLEEIARRNASDIDVLRSCRRVIFGGAPMNPDMAKVLISHNVPLVAVFGWYVFPSYFVLLQAHPEPLVLRHPPSPNSISHHLTY